jgi:hypothetical protein
MSYRLPEDWKQQLPGHIDDVARRADISVDNGTVTRFYIPCSYVYEKGYTRHDLMVEDHLGWPCPGHPDSSAQQFPPFKTYVDEIDLGSEGYTTVDVCLSDDTIDGLEFTGEIDGSIINLVIKAICHDAQSDDIEVTYAAYAIGSFDDGYGNQHELRDVITKGTLKIIAGPVLHTLLEDE